MAIFINHRFIDRLLPKDDSKNIRYIFIGTFNPGAPDDSQLAEEERKQFEKIFVTKKYQKFNAVMNFYDRPPNRFWGIIDRLLHEDFYVANGMKAKRVGSLKHYKEVERRSTFEQQQIFCSNHGILVTDFIRTINPKSFEGIYDNFDDRKIDGVVAKWNTDFLIDLINKSKTEKVFVNFQNNIHSIPNITSAVKKLSENISSEITYLPSPSGSAGYTYEELVTEWKQHISLI